MAVGNTNTHWLEWLHQRGLFAGKRSILEIGPQDIMAAPAVVGNFIASVEPQAASPHEIAAGFPNDGAQATLRFWAALGLTDYSAIDLGDSRANYRLDLNEPFSLGRQFDVITNFGTLEHVINVANVLKGTHDHLADGGLVLYVLPSRGDYNHGFFNFHSTFYRDLAAANGYELVHLVAVSDIVGQGFAIDASEKPGERPPRRTVWTDITINDAAMLEYRFAMQLAFQSLRRRRLWFKKKLDANVVEYIFGAMRKRGNAPFVMPFQGMYAETFKAGVVHTPQGR